MQFRVFFFPFALFASTEQKGVACWSIFAPHLNSVQNAKRAGKSAKTPLPIITQWKEQRELFEIGRILIPRVPNIKFPKGQN